MKLYKLTDKQGYTRKGVTGETKWKKGFTLTVPPCDNPRLCSSDVIHSYTNPHLALLLNPNHANIKDPQLWEAEGVVEVKDYGKGGGFSLKTIKKLPTPAWFKDCPRDVQTWFAILCAESVLKYFEDKHPGDDRPRKAIEAAKEYLKTKSAYTAADAAYAATRAAYAAAYTAADAARAATRAADAAYAATRAAYAAAYTAADAARAATRAAYAADAAAAAYAAAYAAAAAAAAYAAAEIDFGLLADKAVEMATKGETQ